MIYLFLFILGAVWGSFLNVAISRLPKDESLIFPASHCPHCQRPLAPRDLIPLLSFLWLKGRCRYCGQKIGFRYFLVELLTALCFVLAAVYFPLAMDYPFVLAFISFLLVIGFIDLETGMIPEVLLLCGGGIGLLYALFGGVLLEAVMGAGFGFLFFFLVFKVAFFFYQREAMGFGDVELGAMLGIWLGWPAVVAGIFWAYLFAAGVSILLLLAKRVRLRDAVPFGPFLVLGALYVFFWGSPFLLW